MNLHDYLLQMVNTYGEAKKQPFGGVAIHFNLDQTLTFSQIKLEEKKRIPASQQFSTGRDFVCLRRKYVQKRKSG